MAYKQHFIEWFSGSAIDTTRWTNTTQSGSGMSVVMNDLVDGGVRATSTGSGSNWGQLNFNNKRPFSKTGSVFIGVCKRIGGTGVALIDFGMFGDNLNGNAKQAVMRDYDNNTYKVLLTGAATASSETDSDIVTDFSVHSYKIECTATPDVDLYIDGVLKVTKTTDLPNLDLQPGFKNFAQNSSGNAVCDISYIEAYNT